MLRGRAVRAWSACTALVLMVSLAFGASALGADPPPLPKPDLPPQATPPPPPPPVRPPPAESPQTTSPQPAQPAVVVPVVVNSVAADRRAAATRSAAAAGTAAAARIAQRLAAQKRSAAQRRDRPRAELSSPAGDGSASALPFLIVAFGTALVLLGLALTPAWAVPWSRASRALEARRDELGVIGGMSLVATLLFFLLVQVTKG